MKPYCYCCIECGELLLVRMKGVKGPPPMRCIPCGLSRHYEYMNDWQYARDMSRRAVKLAGRKCRDCGKPIPVDVKASQIRCDACHTIDGCKRQRRRFADPLNLRKHVPKVWAKDGLTGKPCEECGLPICAFRGVTKRCLSCSGKRWRAQSAAQQRKHHRTKKGLPIDDEPLRRQWFPRSWEKMPA